MSEEEKFQKIIAHFEKELANLRIGRAMPSIVENIIIEAYGSKSPLMQMAAINVPEPQTLIIQPWDTSIIKDIEKGIRLSNLDLNPIVDGKNIRINFPSLTEEKRRELVKLVHQKAEDAKISIKNIREEFLRDLKKMEKEKAISEDEKFKQEKDLQKTVEEFNEKVKNIAAKKEKDLLTV